MVYIILRCFILYFVIVIAVRIMGKRQIGELQPSELVITILISELGSMPIQDINQPILSGILPILMLAAIEVCVSLITLKSVKARYLMYGKPIVLVYKGKVDQKEMARARVSVDDLIEAMRTNGIMKLSDIDYAILETNGNVSIIAKAEKQPLTPEDMKIKPSEQNMPDIMIVDGRVLSENLKSCNLTHEWLDRVVSSAGASSEKEIFFLAREKTGKTFIIKKEKSR